ncbi:hypothetical protein [Parasphingorhabdus cellanae]|uniref:DUF1844 domain-containing protein n=1 Tax=Parasphingorhabdus cellanae TaxID=2806553 RepID=A0ABX7T0S0_9SPHN|nr:hypothetical protein [Parasphingorhabdus cellanae]QTD55135.1 hypothetical protein J4G78_12990 [Parasphingorhabdus cellanae]
METVSGETANPGPAFKPDDTPKDIYGPDGKPKFFDDPGMDRFVAVVMNMAQEMWVQEERLMALEGQEASDADREAKLKIFIDRIFAPLREQGSDDA